MSTRYPLSMHRLIGGEIHSKTATSGEAEAELAAAGYSPKVPRLPVEEAMQAAPINLIPQVSAEAFAALVARVEKLEQQKRGPGRPPRNNDDASR